MVGGLVLLLVLAEGCQGREEVLVEGCREEEEVLVEGCWEEEEVLLGSLTETVHGVRGEVIATSSSTFTISNFSYDGLGPEVVTLTLL